MAPQAPQVPRKSRARRSIPFTVKVNRLERRAIRYVARKEQLTDSAVLRLHSVDECVRIYRQDTGGN